MRQGDACAASFVAEHDGAYPDAELQERLGKIAQRLGCASHRPDLPYRFSENLAHQVIKAGRLVSRWAGSP